MVRIIVGIMIQIGLNNYDSTIFKDILEGNCNINYKKIAPALGLYLNNVFY